MEIVSDLYFAPICVGCSAAHTEKLNLFELSGGGQKVFRCSTPGCEMPTAAVQRLKNGNYTVSVSCRFCGEVHREIYRPAELWREGLDAVVCPETDMDAMIFGSRSYMVPGYPDEEQKKRLQKAIDKFNSKSDDVYNDDEDDDFAEQMTFFAHKLIFEGRAECTCGNRDIFSAARISAGEKEQLKLRCEICGKTVSFEVNHDNLLRLMNTNKLVFK